MDYYDGAAMDTDLLLDTYVRGMGKEQKEAMRELVETYGYTEDQVKRLAVKYADSVYGMGRRK